MAVRITKYNDLSEIKNEDLREESEGWLKGHNICCGTAIIVPDDGSGPMEGFFDSNQQQGMIVWGDSLSDWIEADDLESMFRSYIKNMM